MTSQVQADKELLSSVNQFLEQSVYQPCKHPIEWKAITSQGSTNRHYRVQLTKQALILRVNSTNELAFGVSRQSEASILELIQRYDWAPKVIKNNWQGGWCLMLDHGPTVAPDMREKVTSRLFASVVEWQTIPPSICDQFDYDELFEAYRSALLNTGNTSLRTAHLSLLDQLINTFKKLPSVPLCLTHHDLHPENLCGNEHQLTVLDWEYAGFGNPWFDAAALHGKFGIATKLIGTLPAFKHLNNTQLIQGINDAIKAATLLERLWHAVRANHYPPRVND